MPFSGKQKKPVTQRTPAHQPQAVVTKAVKERILLTLSFKEGRSSEDILERLSKLNITIAPWRLDAALAAMDGQRVMSTSTAGKTTWLRKS